MRSYSQKLIHDDDIGSDLLQMQQNMCFILLHAMEPFMAPLLSFVPAQAHVMYGLLLSPRYKELRQVDELWAAVHHKEERKVACLRVIEQYEAGLIDLMVAAPLFGREEIVIGEEDTTPPGVSTGSPLRGGQRNNTAVEDARRRVSRSLRGGSGAQFPTLIPSSCLPRLRKRTHSFV
mmetsp:Transcript_90156/g.131951  ORF Transcript_90156/g.131951 Transcript_90156/m.131951 type:complete len:177 (+) Transcript_90156:361-891(+)